ncbi:MAG: zf-HC2 domain-containing protein, partial [Candidatus Firestonebacteria bacterium]
MTQCDKLKIADYNEGRLSGADLFAVEEHLTECSECAAYQKSNEKLVKLLNGWEEKTEFSEAFDSTLLAQARVITSRQQRLSFVFSSAWKTAAAFCLIFTAITAYKNTLYDGSLQNLKAVSRMEFTSKIEIKDFKIFTVHRLCREMAKITSDQKNLINYELMLAVPDNILLEEQKSDLRELLSESVKSQEAGKNIVLRALDEAVNKIEKTIKVDFSFAKGVSRLPVPDIYRQATLDFENEKYESAFDGYKIVYGEAKDELYSCSALFRMAFIKDMMRSEEEACFYYKTVSDRYPLSVQAIMSGEMGRFSKQKNAIEARIRKLKSEAEKRNADSDI